ncbi:hypothetical protein QVD17_19466 [Tagetes erecta]|uniref:Uncharacterized protein n=1 Tax=Tagetes erecta TaxID=13708 RepID=A0AAD8KMC8_TARER|nr:hypothetical protein QVD17_19466 [Tagetes erecta]
MSTNNSSAEEAQRILNTLNKLNPHRVLRYFSFMYLEIGVEPFLLWFNSLVEEVGRVFNALADAGRFEETERIPEWLKDYIQEREVVFTDDDPMAFGYGSSVPDENSVVPPVKDEEHVFAPGISVPSKHFAKPDV